MDTNTVSSTTAFPKITFAPLDGMKIIQKDELGNISLNDGSIESLNVDSCSTIIIDDKTFDVRSTVKQIADKVQSWSRRKNLELYYLLQDCMRLYHYINCIEDKDKKERFIKDINNLRAEYDFSDSPNELLGKIIQIVFAVEDMTRQTRSKYVTAIKTFLETRKPFDEFVNWMLSNGGVNQNSNKGSSSKNKGGETNPTKNEAVTESQSIDKKADDLVNEANRTAANDEEVSADAAEANPKVDATKVKSVRRAVAPFTFIGERKAKEATAIDTQKYVFDEHLPFENQKPFLLYCIAVEKDGEKYYEVKKVINNKPFVDVANASFSNNEVLDNVEA